ncbi:hypothetical protein LOK49_LG11G02019 [Camellia lanceoleosa]|uniref:Uncharacterized protein n=1 Tax=Camellia lanceoleosa TaxID=1840588 RepID=A0ACC0G0Y5_9ERIC|nr:hypothetical protein LOK49_LG11G02019 [Camellia lanceoleosa]
MNGIARSLAFANDGQHLLSSGGDGHIYHWDLRTRACFYRVVDEGCINGSTLCTSPNGSLFAACSDTGIVNVYNREEFLGGKRRPIKTIENLTTRVDFMKFNNDAQILAISSSMNKSSLKLIHVPSFTIFPTGLYQIGNYIIRVVWILVPVVVSWLWETLLEKNQNFVQTFIDLRRPRLASKRWGNMYLVRDKHVIEAIIELLKGMTGLDAKKQAVEVTDILEVVKG